MAKNVRKIKRRDETTLEISVEEAMYHYIETTHVKQLSPRTQEEYRQELGVFAEWCATHAVTQDKRNKAWSSQPLQGDDELMPVMLHQVTDQVVHCFLEHLRDTHTACKPGASQLSTHTLAGYVKVIKSFLNWCMRDEQYAIHVKSVVIERIEKPQIIDVIIEAFQPEQISALFAACDKEESEHLQVRDRAILAVLLDTGIRATELCTLTIGHVHLDAKDSYIRVLGKGKKWGEIGLGEQSRRYIQKYIRMFREPTIEDGIDHPLQGRRVTPEQKRLRDQAILQSLLFVNRNGNPLTKSGLYRIIERLGEWAHIEGARCSPHTFRHTFAKMFIENGGDIYKLSKLLRHSSVQVTEDYLKSLRQSFARKGAKSVLDNL